MTESNLDDPSSKTWLGRVRWLISKPQFDWAMGSWIEGKPFTAPAMEFVTPRRSNNSHAIRKKRATPHVKSTDDCITLAASTNRATHAITLNHMFRISFRFFSRLQNDAFRSFLTGTDAALKHSKVYSLHKTSLHSHANAKSAGISAQRVGRCWKHYACFQTDRPHPATPFDTSPIPRLPRKIRLSRFIAHATAFWMSL